MTPIPVPKSGEVLLQICNAGIYGSDMHFFKKGHGLEIPIILGHEATVTIVGVGLGVDKERLGNRGVIETNIPSGTLTGIEWAFGAGGFGVVLGALLFGILSDAELSTEALFFNFPSHIGPSCQCNSGKTLEIKNFGVIDP